MMPLAPSYRYHVWPENTGVGILLSHPASGAEKRFYLAAVSSIEQVSKHMDSLTESQCEQFLSVKAHGKKGK